MKVAVLHDRIAADAAPDQQDVLDEVRAVSECLQGMGFHPLALGVSRDLQTLKQQLREIGPTLVFNLVECLEGQGCLIHLAPGVLDSVRVPYTGSPTESLYRTSNKLLAKEMMGQAGIPTPETVDPERGRDLAGGDETGEVIIKSVWEHASIGLDEDSVLPLGDVPAIAERLKAKQRQWGGEWFAERYIAGREFNVALLAGEGGPEVLPPAEMCFLQYPDRKLKVVDYRAKWEHASFEFVHTRRRFDLPRRDRGLLAELSEIARRCWSVFGLRGYARVDFRVDAEGRPWVLEVNANPCLSPDAGFAAAAARAGLELKQVVERIVREAVPGAALPAPLCQSGTPSARLS